VGKTPKLTEPKMTEISLKFILSSSSKFYTFKFISLKNYGFSFVLLIQSRVQNLSHHTQTFFVVFELSVYNNCPIICKTLQNEKTSTANDFYFPKAAVVKNYHIQNATPIPKRKTLFPVVCPQPQPP